MSLKFVYGPSRSDHSLKLIENAKKWLAKDDNHQVYYLVPNHVKFESEVNILNKSHSFSDESSDDVALMNLQVFSFSRLAWYFLQHTPLYSQKTLTNSGKQMILRLILKEEQDNLTVYRGEIEQIGFIEQLSDFITEMQQGNITEDDLASLLDGLTQNHQMDTKQKIQDIRLITQRYLSFIQEEGISEDTLLLNLADYLAQVDLSQTQFILTGFTRFTAQEQSLIEALMKYAGSVVVDLNLDKPYVEGPPAPFDLFYDSGLLYASLYQLARKNQIAIEKDVKIAIEEQDDLAVLDHFWQASSKLSKSPKIAHEKIENIEIWKTENAQTEIEHIAREIRRLVSQEGYRYKEIEILSRNGGSYHERIKPIFDKQAIPYYLNEELSMKHHPLVELLDALFAIEQRYFRYKDIMRFLRTELFIPEQSHHQTEDWLKNRDEFRNHVDITENVILAYGYEGASWTRKQDWKYVNYIQSEEDIPSKDSQAERVSNQIRQELRDTLVPFYKAFKDAKTGKEGAVMLYEFLVSIGVEQQLLNWRNYYIAAGDLEEAKIHEQSWKAFVDLLDEFVEILGDRPFDMKEFIEILMVGLESTTYSKVPTTIDQVKVSALDKVHAKKNKITFIIGATDKNMPAKAENTTLLTDDEREAIMHQLADDKYLLPTNSQSLNQEPYIAYLAFLSSSEKLYLTYPLSGEKGSVGKVSPYVTRIADGLGIKPIEKNFMPKNEEVEVSFIGTYQGLIDTLIRIKRQSKDEEKPVSKDWTLLEEDLKKKAGFKLNLQAENVFSSLEKKNIPENLEKEIVEELYGDTLYGSVSRIERFYQCQYKYFMTYGLKLREREVYDLTPATAGELFHEALDLIFKELVTRDKLLNELTDAEVNEVAESVLEKVFAESQFMILSSSNRMSYIRYQLSQTIKRVSWALQRQSMRTGMSVLKTEVLFGEIAHEKGFQSIQIALENNKQMKISGKIDRIDYYDGSQDSVAPSNEKILSVVDYKSSKHNFNFEDAYVGLALQMITYLDVALLNTVELVGESKVDVGGAFYLHIQNPRLKAPISEEKLEEELLKSFKYSGLLIEDEKVLEQLDTSLLKNQDSAVYPVRKNKDDCATPGRSFKNYVNTEQTDELIQHNRKLFKDAGEKIYRGDVALDPAYRKKKRIACEHCPFRSVCQFDAMLPENNYRRLESLKKEQVLERIHQDKSVKGDEV